MVRRKSYKYPMAWKAKEVLSVRPVVVNIFPTFFSINPIGVTFYNDKDTPLQLNVVNTVFWESWAIFRPTIDIGVVEIRDYWIVNLRSRRSQTKPSLSPSWNLPRRPSLVAGCISGKKSQNDWVPASSNLKENTSECYIVEWLLQNRSVNNINRHAFPYPAGIFGKKSLMQFCSMSPNMKFKNFEVTLLDRGHSSSFDITHMSLNTLPQRASDWWRTHLIVATQVVATDLVFPCSTENLTVNEIWGSSRCTRGFDGMT